MDALKARMTVFALLTCALMLAWSPAARAQDGMIIKNSPYSVSETLDRLTQIATKKGFTIFARIDHKAGAEKVGLTLRPTQTLIFGNPKGGTLLMQADPRSALDLPLKAAAWEDAQGKVHLGYWAANALKARYGITGRDPVFAKITGALAAMTDAAVAAK